MSVRKKVAAYVDMNKCPSGITDYHVWQNFKRILIDNGFRLYYPNKFYKETKLFNFRVICENEQWILKMDTNARYETTNYKPAKRSEFHFQYRYDSFIEANNWAMKIRLLYNV